MAGLLGRHDLVFLEDDQLQAGMAKEQLASRGQADDAAAYESDVVEHAARFLPADAGARRRQSDGTLRLRSW